MFGYIYINEKQLKEEELVTYRSFYCGLCHALHVRHGRIAQMMLNYDLTFLAMLLSGLYELESVKRSGRCIPHPVKLHEEILNDAVSYAADMCVLLSWHKLADDWKDEKKLLSGAAEIHLRKEYAALVKKYPRQSSAIESCIAELTRVEKENCREIDLVAGLTGTFLAEVFVWKEDLWQGDLRQLGFFLGKFIYLMDAVEDVSKDKKRGNYNLFSDWGDVFSPEKEKVISQMLISIMAEAAKAFERLPIIENAEIMRNIIYSGVFCKFAGLKIARRKQHEPV